MRTIEFCIEYGYVLFGVAKYQYFRGLGVWVRWGKGALLHSITKSTLWSKASYSQFKPERFLSESLSERILSIFLGRHHTLRNWNWTLFPSLLLHWQITSIDVKSAYEWQTLLQIYRLSFLNVLCELLVKSLNHMGDRHAVQDLAFDCQHFSKKIFHWIYVWVCRWNLKLPIFKCATPICRVWQQHTIFRTNTWDNTANRVYNACKRKRTYVFWCRRV